MQDTRHATTRIQTTLDSMGTNLEVVCREATRSGIQEAIAELKEEAWQVSGGANGRDQGFHSGEAEKLIEQVHHTICLSLSRATSNSWRTASHSSSIVSQSKTASKK